MQNRKKKLGFVFIALLFSLLLGVLIWYFLKGGYENPNLNDFKNWLINGKVKDQKIESVNWKMGQWAGNYTINGVFSLVNNQRYQFRIVVSGETLWKDLYKTINETKFKVDSMVGYDPAEKSIWYELIKLLPFILIFGGSTFLILKMMRAPGSGGGMNPFSMGKSRARQTQSKVRFGDVAGINEEKQELVEIVDYLKNPTRYAQMGARTPKGVLLEGPPGTGKTLLAKAVAGEANVPFFSISGSEFEEMFVGVGASRVRELFNNAKKSAPCIIFIDEIDAVGRKRSVSVGSGANEQTLNQLLVEMDGFETNAGVIIIAATNRVDVLDPALLRPGRFDRTIQLSLPDIREREAILRLHSRNKNISSKITFNRVAARTPGFSGAQLENVLNEATLLAVRKRKTVIDLVDIDEAIDRVVGGPAKTSRTITENDKQVVSYHEAGHALVGLKLKHASKVQKVTIIPRGNAGGYTIMTPKEESFLHSRDNLLATIAGYLGGRASEELIFGKEKITTGAHDDLEKATNIARRMVVEFGMSNLGLRQFESAKDEYLNPNASNKFSDDIAQKIDFEINKILDECFVKAKNMIEKHRNILDLIAESLRVLETITAEQIEYIDEHEKLPEEVVNVKNMQEDLRKKEANGDFIEVKPKSKNSDITLSDIDFDKNDDNDKKE